MPSRARSSSGSSETTPRKSPLSRGPDHHGPNAHRTFHITTDDYREQRLVDLDSEHAPAPMGNGYLSGVNGALVTHGLDHSLVVNVLSTSVHARGPDVDGALRLLETVVDIYGLDVDTTPLEEFAASVAGHHERPAEHVEDTQDDTRYDDRIFM
jgi:uncharacterized protein